VADIRVADVPVAEIQVAVDTQAVAHVLPVAADVPAAEIQVAADTLAAAVNGIGKKASSNRSLYSNEKGPYRANAVRAFSTLKPIIETGRH
jgi:hypothetical protein